MVKFLSARQESAERLGVQKVSFSGYLCLGADQTEPLEELSPEPEVTDQDLTTGHTLLRKTLFFIQQLTRDMVNSLISKEISVSVSVIVNVKVVVYKGDQWVCYTLLPPCLPFTCPPVT